MNYNRNEDGFDTEWFMEQYKIIKEDNEALDVDYFDDFMMRYGSYIRIGTNRSYVKFCEKDGMFHFVVLFDPEICMAFQAVWIKFNLVRSEEEALGILRSIEFSSELLYCESKDFFKASIYAMSGCYSQDGRKVVRKGLSDREADLNNISKFFVNPSLPCDMIKM